MKLVSSVPNSERKYVRRISPANSWVFRFYHLLVWSGWNKSMRKRWQNRSKDMIKWKRAAEGKGITLHAYIKFTTFCAKLIYVCKLIIYFFDIKCEHVMFITCMSAIKLRESARKLNAFCFIICYFSYAVPCTLSVLIAVLSKNFEIRNKMAGICTTHRFWAFFVLLFSM